MDENFLGGQIMHLHSSTATKAGALGSSLETLKSPRSSVAQPSEQVLPPKPSHAFSQLKTSKPGKAAISQRRVAGSQMIAMITVTSVPRRRTSENNSQRVVPVVNLERR